MNLRLATPGDAKNIWLWRNHSDARAASFDSEPIPYEDHVIWFQKRLDDEDNVFLIIQDDDDRDAGYARFLIAGDKAEISIALAKEAQGQRLGSASILAASNRVLEQRSVRSITAQIKMGNAISECAFRRSGYRKSIAFTGGSDYIELVFDGFEPSVCC
jgi:UDP-2,4-diacetamido-2,4,6-trideoxy-beta-L-altropyranose hydrolase